jgi:hypothetical protein
MLHAVNGDVVWPHYAARQRGQPPAHACASARGGFNEESGQVSSRTASSVLTVECQQTAADEREGQHNAVQLVFDVWH